MNPEFIPRIFRASFCALLLVWSSCTDVRSEEGMYPLTMLHALDLSGTGLEIPPDRLYSPGGRSLVEGIINVGGCTGAFVSADGLILTNHHCVFRTLQGLSTPDNDRVTDGFLARTRAEEVYSPGHTVRIVRSYRDVSAEMLSGLPDTLSPGDRERALEIRRGRLEQEAEEAAPGTRAQVAEMFTGKSYVLFLSTYLRDVRLVYAPPRGIGEFGGEEDNWVWPRHTGDFAFLRAYVAPDGSPAVYDPANVPYHPETFLSVQPSGVNEGDPVFILGYPGRTYRNRTSHYVEFEEQVRMPFVADLYEWQIDVMTEAGKLNRAVALKHDARIRSLANTMKNYRGKLQGLRRVGIVSKKREEERKMQAFILSDPARARRYGTLLEDINKVYAHMEATAPRDLVLDYLRTSSSVFRVTLQLCEAERERAKPEAERLSAYRGRNYDRTLEMSRFLMGSFHKPVDRTLFEGLLLTALRLPRGLRITPIDSLVEGKADTAAALAAFLDRLYSTTRLTDSSFVDTLLADPDLLSGVRNDPFLVFAGRLLPEYDALREVRRKRDGTLGRLSADVIDVKMRFLNTTFIPDANNTLRFTYGHIRGYSPADAVFCSPITTLNGVVEKTTGKEPYNTPRQLLELVKLKKFGRYVHPDLHSVPVGLLYDLDTTGGNSGSPLLNARGELVGVNFDRAIEATLNDFAWDDNYSRSIAVDIRYVLWVTQYIGGAQHIIRELGL